MKKILFLFILNFYFGFSQEYIVEDEVLKGKPKSIELTVSSENSSEIPIESKTFDEKGRIILFKKFYNNRIDTQERTKHTKNQIITELCDGCNDLDKEFAEFSIKENQKNPYSGYLTADPRRTFKTFKTTDKNGNVILSKTYNPEGYLIWENRYNFDKNSKLLSTETFDDEGKKEKEYIKNTYNTQGLLIESINVMHHYETKTVYEYDKQNRKITEKVWQDKKVNEYKFEYPTLKDTSKILKYYKNPDDNSFKLSTSEVTYFENKNKIKRLTGIYNDKINYTHFFVYDPQHKLISKTYYNDKNELRTEITITYDQIGNWIEMNVSNLINVSYNGGELKPEWRRNKYIRKIQYN